MRMVELPDTDRLDQAARVVARFLDPTPVLRAPELGDQVFLKLETMQPTGSFKVRGGLAAVAAAQAGQAATALVAASAGNHGLGVAYAAAKMGARATVVVSEHASEAEVSALGRYGVEPSVTARVMTKPRPWPFRWLTSVRVASSPRTTILT